MLRDSSVFLDDILRAIAKIRRYTRGMTKSVFHADEKTVDAVVRNLEIIGEAAKRVPDSFRMNHPQVEWRRIGSLRDILTHEYFGVDMDIFWDILKNKLPQLEKQVRAILREDRRQ